MKEIKENLKRIVRNKFCAQIIANNCIINRDRNCRDTNPPYKPNSSQSRPQLHSHQIKVPRSFASFPREKKNEDFSQTWRDTTSRCTLWARSRYIRTRSEKKRTRRRRRRTVAAEEAARGKGRSSGAETELCRKSLRQYGITGKSAINQGSPGTELGNCLLKNRNDVNPGVPASELPFDARIYRQSGK